MHFVQEVSAVFPKAHWTGRSSLHVSMARYSAKWSSKLPKAEVLAALLRCHRGVKIYHDLQQFFEGMEWLLDAGTFEKLFLIDVSRALSGLPPSNSDEQLRNPITKNLFHRIALCPPYIGGIRFWVQSEGSVKKACYRFRIVKQLGISEQHKVREESRNRESQVAEEFEDVYACILEVPEPKESQTLETAITLIQQEV